MSRLTLVITVIGLLIGLIVFYPRITYAEDPFSGVCSGRSSSSSACQTHTTTNPLLGPNGIITKVIEIMIMIAGVASVIMIMVGGFKYMVSNGDSGKVSSAKDTILYSIIGLVVVVIAQAIVSFVITRL
ncbi:MAG: hypothetical protein H6793_01750 [Candidatus Nomurabacteria bacterium]|nr:MAG: hypothetical protein H6793_01750 [Candidatus Nomurabacteria bacterium]